MRCRERERRTGAAVVGWGGRGAKWKQTLGVLSVRKYGTIYGYQYSGGIFVKYVSTT
jgi:hypothetical protein